MLSYVSNPRATQSALFQTVAAALCAIVVLLTGCATTKSEKAEAQLDSTPSYQPVNVFRADNVPPGVLRTVVLPAWNQSERAPYLDGLDAHLRQELGKKNLFEVIPITRDQLTKQYGAPQYSSVEPLPYNFLKELKKRYDANAVLLTDITRYEPYQPLTIGIRCKLVSIETGQTLWAVDDVFDLGDPRVAAGAKRFQNTSDKQMYPLTTTETMFQSPDRFAKYVAYTIFNTLPTR